MISNRVELLARRRLVRAFINAEPVNVAITRRVTRTRTPAGGWTTTPSYPALPPQRARLVPDKRRYDNGLTNAEAGEIPRSQYLLIGYHDLNIAVDDEFTVLGEHYKVTGVVANREERTLCSVDAMGPTNG